MSDRQFGFFAVAALMATRKRTPKAAKRCLKRMTRAVIEIESRSAGDPVATEMAAGAKTLLERNCRMCGNCRGL